MKKEDDAFRCEFVIEATDFEISVLRSRYRKRIKTWKDDNNGFRGITSGVRVTAGEVGGRPINITLWFVLLEGYRVCFYNPCSQLVDHKIVDRWLEKNCLPPSREDRLVQKCNAGSFATCLQELKIQVKPTKRELELLSRDAIRIPS